MSNKIIGLIIFLSFLTTVLVSNLVRNLQENKEKARLESVLAPLVDRAVQEIPDPKPTLFFVVATEKSLMVVLRGSPDSPSEQKNEVRDRVSVAVRRELASDPKSWGRHVSVIFENEVVTQGWK